MKLMMAVDAGSTGLPEISLFQRLSDGNGITPLRFAPAPVAIALHELVFAEPAPPLDGPGPLPVPPPVPDPPVAGGLEVLPVADEPPQPVMIMDMQQSVRASRMSRA